MSTSPTAVPKVRTFATDLQAARLVTGNNSAGSAQATPALPVTPIATASTENGIPPFHTFSHSEKVSPSTPAVPESAPVTHHQSQAETQKILSANGVLSAQGAARENAPAVIITDTKHKRFKLSEAITTSVATWWADKQKAAQQKKIPKYTVPEAEMRKGVIQKATAKTGRTSSADHSAVLSRIKAAKQIPNIQNTPLPPSPVISSTPTWESNTDTSPILAQTTIINPRVVKKGSGTVVIPPIEHNDTISAPQVWESPIQAEVNALAHVSQKNDSPIILTGKEFTRIKQQRQANSVPGETLAPTPIPALVPIKKITPIIPAVPSSLSIAEPAAKIEIVTPPQPVIPPIIPVQPKPAAAEVFVPTPIARAKITPIIPTAPMTTSLPPLRTQTESVPYATPSPVPTVSIDVQSPIEAKPPERRFAPPRETKRGLFTIFSQTNHIVFITCGVLIFVIASGLGLRSYLAADTPAPEVTTSSLDTTFSGTVLYNAGVRVENKQQISDAIITQSAGGDSLVEVVLSDRDGNVLTGPTLLAIFGASVPFDFSASLSTVKLGGYRGEPWLLFTVSDKNTALGGMLSWEKSLSRDLSPLFTTTGLSSQTQFTDSIINSIDVRVLKDSAGVEKIIYGFIGYNQLLITTNTTAFLNLTNKISY